MPLAPLGRGHHSFPSPPWGEGLGERGTGRPHIINVKPGSMPCPENGLIVLKLAKGQRRTGYANSVFGGRLQVMRHGTLDGTLHAMAAIGQEETLTAR